MIRHRCFPYLRAASAAAAMACALAAFDGCQSMQEKPPPPKIKYATVPKRNVPPFMQDTIYEVTNLQNDNPFLVSAWGLVVNLDGTGGSERIPNNVKAFMMKEMEKNGFGSQVVPGYAQFTPNAILRDRNAAVVSVWGWIPPGARRGQAFDAYLEAADENVRSLARGQLFRTELTINGADPIRPLPPVNVFGRARGPVYVNPAAVLRTSEPNAPAAMRRSLRTGRVIGGAIATQDRPLLLALRQPQRRLARAIETRVNEYFHRDRVCTAYDEGYCQLWVPDNYRGDWEHFSKLVMHLYLRGGSEAFAKARAKELVAEAMKPQAPLQDISYCWEGLGANALPALAPLLAEGSADVRFAAAKAAAYIGDPSGAAERALFDLASERGPFQLASVKVLGRIDNSPAVNHLLRQLLDSDESTVRIEAYAILAANNDPSVQTQVVSSSASRSADGAATPKFMVDFVHSNGQPLIYATQSGGPRIAIFGPTPELQIPITFATMDHRLMISSGTVGRNVTIFYRDAQLPQPVQMQSNPDLAELLARFAGQTDDGTGQLDFNYSEVLAILQALSDQGRLRVTRTTGEQVATAFVLQPDQAVRNAIESAAPLGNVGRPQGENNAPRLDAPAQPPVVPGADGGAAAPSPGSPDAPPPAFGAAPGDVVGSRQ